MVLILINSSLSICNYALLNPTNMHFIFSCKKNPKPLTKTQINKICVHRCYTSKNLTSRYHSCFTRSLNPEEISPGQTRIFCEMVLFSFMVLVGIRGFIQSTVLWGNCWTSGFRVHLSIQLSFIPPSLSQTHRHSQAV